MKKVSIRASFVLAAPPLQEHLLCPRRPQPPLQPGALPPSGFQRFPDHQMILKPLLIHFHSFSMFDSYGVIPKSTRIKNPLAVAPIVLPNAFCDNRRVRGHGDEGAQDPRSPLPVPT